MVVQSTKNRFRDCCNKLHSKGAAIQPDQGIFGKKLRLRLQV